jgi:anti-sigma-K factor RskA
MKHQNIIDLLPAYALGALEPVEALQLEEHLNQCAECREELRQYMRLVDKLPLAVSLRSPPVELKERILGQLEPPVTAQPVQKSSAWRELSAWFNRWAPAWGAGSLILILILLVSNILLWQRQQRMDAANQFFVIALAGTDLTPDASAVLIISSEGDDGTLVVKKLPTLTDDRQYQLWLIRDGVRTSGGVFSVYSNGYGHLSVRSDDPLISYESFGVTIEPAGGSAGPTGEQVLGGDL